MCVDILTNMCNGMCMYKCIHMWVDTCVDVRTRAWACARTCAVRTVPARPVYIECNASDDATDQDGQPDHLLSSKCVSLRECMGRQTRMANLFLRSQRPRHAG